MQQHQYGGFTQCCLLPHLPGWGQRSEWLACGLAVEGWCEQQWVRVKLRLACYTAHLSSIMATIRIEDRKLEEEKMKTTVLALIAALAPSLRDAGSRSCRIPHLCELFLLPHTSRVHLSLGSSYLLRGRKRVSDCNPRYLLCSQYDRVWRELMECNPFLSPLIRKGEHMAHTCHVLGCCWLSCRFLWLCSCGEKHASNQTYTFRGTSSKQLEPARW